MVPAMGNINRPFWASLFGENASCDHQSVMRARLNHEAETMAPTTAMTPNCLDSFIHCEKTFRRLGPAKSG